MPLKIRFRPTWRIAVAMVAEAVIVVGAMVAVMVYFAR